MKTCVICEQPGHRYGSTDPYHESVASACINSLKRRVAELEASVDQLKDHSAKLSTALQELRLERDGLYEALRHKKADTK